MGYMTDGLTFNTLRNANVARQDVFKDAKGREVKGSEWALSKWMNAVLGELGEAANIIKKIERGDLTLDEAREALADEFADVQTYLDLIACKAGIDLGRATISKWNRVAKRIGCNIRIADDGSDWHYHKSPAQARSEG